MTAVTPVDTYILCLVAGTTYAMRSGDVRHMEMLEQITAVPNAAGFLDGVVFSRGQIVPVVNLRARFGFEKAPYDLQTRLVIVQAGDRHVGLVVDSAREFVRIPGDAIQPPSQAITDPSTSYLDGVATIGDRIVLVLNVASVVETSVVPGEPVAGQEASSGAAGHSDTRM